MVREIVKRSTERVAGLIPFGDATEDLVGGNASLSPGEGDKLVEAISVPDVAPTARNTRTSRTELLDHGRDLTGLRKDDHELYYRHDGGRALSGNVNTGGQYRYFGRGIGGSTGAILELEGTQEDTATFVHIVSASDPWAPSIKTAGPSANISLVINPKGSGITKIYDLQFAGTITGWSAAQHSHQGSSTGGTLDHNLALSNLQGGTATEYYHLTASEHTELNAWLDDVTLADGGGMTLGGPLDVTGDITLSGTVDGRDVDADGGVLDLTLITAAAIANHAVVRGHGGLRGTQDSSVFITDAGNITLTGTVDGEDVAAVGALAASALQDVVDDTSPELGGELDAGANTIGFTQQTATGDGTTTIDWTAGNKFKFTFGAQNETFTFDPAPSNPCNLILMLIQDGTGGRTATWPGTVKWPGGVAPAISSGANDVDIVSFYYDGTNYYGQIALNFS